jgi:hypothetical protein
MSKCTCGGECIDEAILCAACTELCRRIVTEVLTDILSEEEDSDGEA